MRFELASEWPIWLLPFCILLGLAVSWYLYLYRSNRSEVSKGSLWFLFALRALSISLISFLIIAPFIISKDPIIEEPILIFAEDKSLSIKYLTDSVELESYLASRNEAVEALSDKFEVNQFNFGEELREGSGEEKFSDRLTDMSSAMREIEDRFENRNVALMIISGDGVFNKGLNPLYLESSFNYPIYTIALGDTTIRRDVRIGRVNHNNLAFVGNSFEVEITVQADLLKGRSSSLSVRQSDKTYATQKIEITEDEFSSKISLKLPAEKLGIQRYEVEVESIDGEFTTANNIVYFFVEVLEAQQKILVLSAVPHPDLAAIKSAISDSKNYKVESFLVKDFNKNLEDYDCIVLNQLPSKLAKIDIERIENLGIPVLYIVGKSTDIDAFNELEAGLNINRFNGNFNESTPILNNGFQYFTLDDITEKDFSQYPPVLSPFGAFELDGQFTSLASQKIGKVETDYPMIGFFEKEGRKTGVIAGEGVWRWKMYDFRLNGNNSFFNALFQKMIQYLAVREDRSRFRVTAGSDYFENENVMLDAEYYNKSFELNNDFPAQLNLSNEQGSLFQYDFLPMNESYRLDLGKLESGNYHWKATLNDGVEEFVKEGNFSIKPLQLELSSVIANHGLLFNLATRNGGKMVHVDEFDALVQELLESENFKPIIHYNEKLKELISLKWIFFLLLISLSTEWFIRKWLGLN